jgi:hypothetical protein
MQRKCVAPALDYLTLNNKAVVYSKRRELLPLDKNQHLTRIESSEPQPFEPQITRVIREKKERRKAIFLNIFSQSSEKFYSLCALTIEISADLMILLKSAG